MNHKTLPVAAQAAAVRSLLHDEGRKLRWIKKYHPELAAGIAQVEAEIGKGTRPRGSGSMVPVLPVSARKNT